MTLMIRNEGGYEVWITLYDAHPVNDVCGFIFGTGETRDQAVEHAIRVLQEAIVRLRRNPRVPNDDGEEFL